MARPPAKPALALIALLAAALVIAAATSVSGAATTGARAKKCPHGRVLVKVNSKPTCRPLRSVLPKPKAGDPTLIALRNAVAVDVSTLKGRHGKRARRLPRRAATASRKARKVLLRALPTALRMIADRAHASAGRCGGPGSAQPVGDRAISGCGDPAPAGPQRRGGGGDHRPRERLHVQDDVREMRARHVLRAGLSEVERRRQYLELGSLDVTERIMDGSTLIRQESTSWKYDDRLLGKVMEDAHLRYFDFRRKEEKLGSQPAASCSRGPRLGRSA